ncbi:MAG: hypothetical protein R3F01_06730 [Lysobacteraceae bacterium]
MNRVRNSVLAALAGALLLGCVIWLVTSADDVVRPQENEALQPEDLTENPAPPRGSGISISSRDEVVRGDILSTLRQGGEEAWLELMPSLMALDAASLWELLSDPEVSKQLVARQIQQAVLSNCLSVMNMTPEMRADPTLPFNESALEWCGGLRDAATEDELLAVRREGLRDVELRTSDAVVLRRVDPDKPMSAEDWDLLSNSLRKTQNPFEAEAVAAALLYHRGGIAAPPDLGLEELNPTQMNQLRHAVPDRVACEIARSCGSNSVWTMSYCLSRPGIVCRTGASFDEVLRTNLSPVEYDAMLHTLAWLRQVRGE